MRNSLSFSLFALAISAAPLSFAADFQPALLPGSHHATLKQLAQYSPLHFPNPPLLLPNGTVIVTGTKEAGLSQSIFRGEIAGFDLANARPAFATLDIEGGIDFEPLRLPSGELLIATRLPGNLYWVSPDGRIDQTQILRPKADSGVGIEITPKRPILRKDGKLLIVLNHGITRVLTEDGRLVKETLFRADAATNYSEFWQYGGPTPLPDGNFALQKMDGSHTIIDADGVAVESDKRPPAAPAIALDAAEVAQSPLLMPGDRKFWFSHRFAQGKGDLGRLRILDDKDRVERTIELPGQYSFDPSLATWSGKPAVLVGTISSRVFGPDSQWRSAPPIIAAECRVIVFNVLGEELARVVYPNTQESRWAAQFVGCLTSKPVVTPDGHVLVTDVNGKLLQLDPAN